MMNFYIIVIISPILFSTNELLELTEGGFFFIKKIYSIPIDSDSFQVVNGRVLMSVQIMRSENNTTTFFVNLFFVGFISKNTH
jgi:hypothetical protein